MGTANLFMAINIEVANPEMGKNWTRGLPRSCHLSSRPHKKFWRSGDSDMGCDWLIRGVRMPFYVTSVISAQDRNVRGLTYSLFTKKRKTFPVLIF